MGVEETIDNIEIKQDFTQKAKNFLVDTSANLVYWQPVLFLNNTYVVGMTLKEAAITAGGNISMALLGGGAYCKTIDGFRYVLNKPYYNELKHNIKRDNESLSQKVKNFVRDCGTDTAATCVFWHTLMVPYVKYVVGKSWGEVGTFVVSSTVLYAIAGPPFGKFLNWYRKQFNKKKVSI